MIASPDVPKTVGFVCRLLSPLRFIHYWIQRTFRPRIHGFGGVWQGMVQRPQNEIALLTHQHGNLVYLRPGASHHSLDF